MELTLHVRNIKCTGCAATIENTFKEQLSLEVGVDIEYGTVMVDTDEEQHNEIRTVLETIGYPATN